MNRDTSFLNDCYRIGGKNFPLTDQEQKESGPDGTVRQGDRQKDAGLNASLGINRLSTWGAEGRAFRADDNGKESEDEQPTFAGQRSEVGVSLLSGQITSSDDHRLVPVPQNSNDGQVRPLVKFRKSTSDVRENRL